MSASRHWLFACVIVGVVALLRLLVAGPSDLDVFDQFETTSGLEIGPRTEFAAAGLRGDGSAFAAIAADPLGRDAGHLLHQSSYRYSRYAFPIAARVVVLGNEDLILLGLFAVNLAAVALVSYAGSYLSEQIGLRAWLLVCNPALIIGAIWDTSEPLALAFLTYGILSGSAVLAILTAITRPSYIVGFRSWRLLLLAGGTAVVLKGYWSAHFDDSLLEGSRAFSVPFVGVIQEPSLIGVIVMVAAGATLVVGIRRRDLSWILSGAMVVCLSWAVFENPVHALRAAGILPVLWAFGPRFSDTVPLRAVFRPSKLRPEDPDAAAADESKVAVTGI